MSRNSQPCPGDAATICVYTTACPYHGDRALCSAAVDLGRWGQPSTMRNAVITLTAETLTGEDARPASIVLSIDGQAEVAIPVDVVEDDA